MAFRRGVAAGVLLAAAAFTAWAQPRFRFDTTPGHLSKQVVPSRYELTLDLDPARDDFRGDVAIALRVREPVASIELHAHELQAVSARLADAGGMRTLTVVPHPASQTWRLVPEDGRPIGAGAHRLEIAWRGAVHAYDDGLYRAPYGPGGRERMLGTQLEAIHARMLFPAFDEPAFRAAFDIRVRAPSAYTVVSNMPEVARADEGATALHRFAATPPMPTYLVSVAVGRFDVLQDRAAGVPLRVLTAPGRQANARYALDVTRQVLPYYARYFGVPFALPKLDQLAMPSTRRGGMEDWGLISYQEDDLLLDPARSGPGMQRRIYGMVAHEVAHQWFGNLVTAAWWDEIWLNEAFATWMARKAADRMNPSWDIATSGRIRIDEAMATDAGAATRAIRSGPVSETAVDDVFDDITYAKGGAVLGMLEQWIGPAALRNGLVAYMKGQRYANATAGDLWHYIGRAARRDVAAVAASWTDQPGFPLVSANSRCERGRQRVTLAQQRFDGVGGDGGAALWRIPVRLQQGATVSTVLLAQREQRFDLGRCSGVPLVVNAGGAGYYRVAYEPAAFDALVANFASLAPADRVALLSDGFALMQAGRLPPASYVALLGALQRAGDPAVPAGRGRAALWSVATRQLALLDIALAGTPAQEALRDAARALLAPQLAALGWSAGAGDDALSLQLRATLIEQLARFDDEPTIREAQRRFDAEAAGTPIAPAIRAAVLVAVGVHADDAHFERLLAAFKSADSEEERALLAHALASGRDAAHAQALLDAGMAGAARGNIVAQLPGEMARLSPLGELAYRYALAHWSRFAELAGTAGRAALLPDAAAGFSDEAWALRVVDDQRRTAGPDGDAAAARAAAAIRLRASVRARLATSLRDALASMTARRP